MPRATRVSRRLLLPSWHLSMIPEYFSGVPLFPIDVAGLYRYFPLTPRFSRLRLFLFKRLKFLLFYRLFFLLLIGLRFLLFIRCLGNLLEVLFFTRRFFIRRRWRRICSLFFTFSGVPVRWLIPFGRWRRT